MPDDEQRAFVADMLGRFDAAAAGEEIVGYLHGLTFTIPRLELEQDATIHYYDDPRAIWRLVTKIALECAALALGTHEPLLAKSFDIARRFARWGDGVIEPTVLRPANLDGGDAVRTHTVTVTITEERVQAQVAFYNAYVLAVSLGELKTPQRVDTWQRTFAIRGE